MSAAKRFTREELYELVWSEPMSTLGPRFEISDVAFKKTCAKAQIPVPDRGYWARKQAGQLLVRPALALRPPGQGNDVIVGGGQHHVWNDRLTEEEILGPIPEPPHFSDPIEAVRARVGKLIGKVTVPKSIEAAHPAIAQLLQKDEKRREEQRKSSYAFSWNSPIFDEPFEYRRLKLLDALFLALARADVKSWTRGREAREIGATVGQQHLELKLDRPSVPPRTVRGSVPSTSKADDLVLTVFPGWNSEKILKSWQDDHEGRLEAKLAGIATEIIVTGEERHREHCLFLHNWRIERKAKLQEEIRKRHEEAERKARELQVRLAKERIERLLAEADSHRKALDIRAYVDAVRIANAKALSPAPQIALASWIQWALDQANGIDPIENQQYLELSDEERCVEGLPERID